MNSTYRTNPSATENQRAEWDRMVRDLENRTEIEKIAAVLKKFKVCSGKTDSLEGVAEELASTLQDYHDLAQQYGDMLTKYCYEDKPEKRNGVWCCPACNKRISYNHSHCHWCGKKIGWR